MGWITAISYWSVSSIYSSDFYCADTTVLSARRAIDVPELGQPWFFRPQTTVELELPLSVYKGSCTQQLVDRICEQLKQNLGLIKQSSHFDRVRWKKFPTKRIRTYIAASAGSWAQEACVAAVLHALWVIEVYKQALEDMIKKENLQRQPETTRSAISGQGETLYLLWGTESFLFGIVSNSLFQIVLSACRMDCCK